MRILFTCICITFISCCFAQANYHQYNDVDSLVSHLGSMNNFDIATITDQISKPFSSKEKKARAIYFWIAQNISIDPRGTKTNDVKNISPEKTIQRRTATPLGIATLFQEMCSQANVRCLIVNGYRKNFTDEINEIPDEPNFAWNVVQLGESPEQWFYVDACSGLGSLDKKKTVFSKQFCSEYFFSDKKIFNLQHFPTNKAWLLQDGPRSLKEFYSLPIIETGAYTFNLITIAPFKGLLKCKPQSINNFTLTFDEPSNIQNLSILLTEGNKKQSSERLNFTRASNQLSFKYTFKKETNYSVCILANDRPLISYNIEVSE